MQFKQLKRVMVAGSVLLLSAASAQAATFSVTKTADTNDGTCDADCSLREAIAAANAAPGSTIGFDATAFASKQTIVLSSKLSISESVAINGSAAGVEISGGDAVPVLEVVYATAGTVTLKDLALTHGKASSTDEAGGITVGGLVKLVRCTLAYNVGKDGDSAGRQDGPTPVIDGGNGGPGAALILGTLYLNSCSIVSNTGGAGGDGSYYWKTSGWPPMTATVYTGNGGNGGTGAIDVALDGCIITHSTIVKNKGGKEGKGISTQPASGGTGGINLGDPDFQFGAVECDNSIIANNSHGGSNGISDASGYFDSIGYNIIGNTDGNDGFSQIGDKTNIDPLLDASGIKNNGGPTPTIALQYGSPAIDAGSSTEATDQRGVARPQGNKPDIGAFEVVATPTIAVFNAPTINEGSSLTPGQATFNVTLSGPSFQIVAVNYATANGTALAGSDYVATSGTLIFTPGEVSKTVTVTFIGDTVAELNETFFLDLKTPTNATIADSRGSVYIRNDDGPNITIDDALPVFEGNSATTAQSFTVRLSAASPDTVTVNYATNSNTADTSDYVAQSGTLSFAPGETSKTITIQVKGDTLVEVTENYRVKLSSPKFALLADSVGIAYIRNDDTASAALQMQNAGS